MRLKASDTKTLHHIYCPFSSLRVPSPLQKGTLEGHTSDSWPFSWSTHGFFWPQIWLSFKSRRKGKMFSSTALTGVGGEHFQNNSKTVICHHLPTGAPWHHVSKTKGNQSRINRWKRQEEKARLLLPMLGSHLPPSPSGLLNPRELAQAHSQQAEMSRAPIPRGNDHKMVLTLEKQGWPCVLQSPKKTWHRASF